MEEKAVGCAAGVDYVPSSESTSSRPCLRVFLSVYTLSKPVRLQPLHFLRSVAAGDNVQTMCAVQSGDEVDFSWRKDGQPLSASGHRLVIHSLPTTSILLIKNATVFDAGNYTCVGRNALGQDSVTAQLRVEGQPHWLKQPPKEVVVALGDIATLRCDVISFPHARVTWFRIDEDAVEVPPGPRWQGASESSIELSSVSRQDVGTYRCRADNGLGQVSADIELVVRAPERVVESKADATTRLRSKCPTGLAFTMSGNSRDGWTWWRGSSTSMDYPDDKSLPYPERRATTCLENHICCTGWAEADTHGTKTSPLALH
ncbi:hypothetical protein HPB50_012346 [Hyalomma asiaticum]|uniref:Uncharacterized protein n=1 Tax=Hyalomma asiaticum TaxID=266040 RepID=A0ACB7RZ02_HYAAI|nr:hypothetical protein HPB50_012346 [Hyalomma asiaticum]